MNKLLAIVSVLFIIFSTSCNINQTKSSKKKSSKAKVIAPSFNSDSAYKFIEKQVNFGPRVPGTQSHTLCASWLQQKFESYGAEVIIQKFNAQTYDNVSRKGKNIIASFNPDAQNRILLMSHWDSRPFADHDDNAKLHRTPIDGANDGASGVGVLLEMAQQFSKKSPEVGVDIVLFDLEDWGPPNDVEIPYDEEFWGLGSQYWSKNPHKFGYTANYGILLDMVGAKNIEFFREYNSDNDARFAVDIVWDAAADMGYNSVFINKPGGQITDDHYFVNKYAKIPSIDIIHLDSGSKNGSFYDYWHTTGDSIDKIDKQSLQIVGDVLMSVVYNED